VRTCAKPKDPLAQALCLAARRTTDRDVRRWLLALAAAPCVRSAESRREGGGSK
jgi:hypothetical protein